MTSALTDGGQARSLRRLRTRLVGNVVRQALATARLRTCVLVVLTVVFWGTMFWMFFEGFELLHSALAFPSTRVHTVQAIFNVFFISLMAMLIVSSGIVFYGAAYRNEEVDYLLTTPIGDARIVMYKFQETTVFSCWGFILLGGPMLIAYGAVAGAPWYYFALLLPFMVAFVVIPAGIGAMLCMLIVHFLPRLRMHALALGGTLVVALLGLFAWSALGYSQQDMMSLEWFQNVLQRLQLSERRLLPSWWLSSGLLEAAHTAAGDTDAQPWSESLGFLAVLVSNAMMVQLLLTATARRVFRKGFSGLRGLGGSRRRAATGWLDRLPVWRVPVLSRPMRLLLRKDLRLFRRDPVQWMQVGIFFGLLAIYFLNIRRFDYGGLMGRWVQMIGFLNLAVVGLIVSTFTTRFVFPMISLEGRRFWVLGTLPIRRDAVLWSKFLFACVGSVPACAVLVLLSDLMLGIVYTTPTVAAIHQLTILVLCVGLSAIAVGLGARLPNLRESSPSRIASGFGGTLNLVLSALFIVAVMLCTSVPCFFWLHQPGWRSAHFAWLALGSPTAVAVGVAVGVALGAVATILPLWLGLRAFRRLEF